MDSDKLADSAAMDAEMLSNAISEEMEFLIGLFQDHLVVQLAVCQMPIPPVLHRLSLQTVYGRDMAKVELVAEGLKLRVLSEVCAWDLVTKDGHQKWLSRKVGESASTPGLLRLAKQ